MGCLSHVWVIMLVIGLVIGLENEEFEDDDKNEEDITIRVHSELMIGKESEDKETENPFETSVRDDIDEYKSLNIPLERPYTPIVSNKMRVLYPVRILVGESRCIFEKYSYFFNEAVYRNITPFDLLMNANITLYNQAYYFYDAEDLCISVDDELNVDVWQYDCTPAGVCVCGLYFGYVDPDIPSNIEDGQVEYLQVNGLDRKLVVEDGECKSGHKGHCSLLNSNVSLKNPLECSHAYNCVLDDTYGPIIRNAKTEQIYGICLPKKGQSMSGGGARSLTQEENATSTNQATITVGYNIYIVFVCYLSFILLMNVSKMFGF